MINILYLQECLLCEVMIDNIRGYFALIYRSASQNSSEFQHFVSSFLSILKALSLTLQFYYVITMHVQDHGGLTTPTYRRYATWYPNFIIWLATVNEPTHILPSSSSCIDLIFTDQPSLVVNSGTHPSLHANCHH